MDARIVVIQPQTLVRHGLVSMLEGVGGMTVVGETGSPAEGVELTQTWDPDLVLVDIDIPDHERIGLVKTLAGASPNARVVVLAESANRHFVEEAFTESASGYMLKRASVPEFLDGIRRAAAGDLVIHPEAAAIIARSYSTGPGPQGTDQELTPRQREILSLLAEGQSNKQIARRLGIGIETVKTHVSRILQRLEVESRTEAVVIALRDGLVA